MTPNPGTKRRFQFTLRQLLVFTGLAGLLLAVVSREGVRYRQSTTAPASIGKLGGSVSSNPEIAENIIRDQTLSSITDVHFTNPRLNAEEWRTLSTLPHRFGVHIEAVTFTDDTIAHLVEIERLDYLVLKDTKVAEAAIIDFQRQRPDMTVMIGYPGDADFREYPIVRDRTMR